MQNYLTEGTEFITGLILIFIITRMLGKTQISQISPFDFISSLLVG
jgi:uncharacterized membrane protein YcaP (DUF421 family)